MRFSAAIQPLAPREPVPPVMRCLPPRDDTPALQPQVPSFPVHEVPPDLDQRVRLTGEW